MTAVSPSSTPTAERLVEPASTTQMNAAVRRSYTTDPTEIAIERVPRPVPGEGEVLVQVHAAGVDRGVWHLMAGLPYLVRMAGFGITGPKQPILGLDLAGIVESVGSGVTTFAPGDRVHGVGDGSYAELAIAKADKLAPIPADLSFEQAAAIPVSGITALEAVRDHAKIATGERVLILGASGGVGSFAVQVAKAEGAIVTGAASASKADLVRNLGADHTLDYRADPLGKHGPYDAIIDLGGNRRLGELRSLLTKHGRLVIVGGEDGGRLIGGVDRQLRAMLLSPISGRKLGTFIASENGAILRRLDDLIESGQVRPAVDRSFPLDQAPEAIEYMLSGKARGKTVISIR